jgi:signal transduction histidine kinase
MAMGLAFLATAPCAALLALWGAPGYALLVLAPVALPLFAGAVAGRRIDRALAPCHDALQALAARGSLAGAPLPGDLGPAIAALALHIDVERATRAAEHRKLEAAAHKQSQILANILHDLRTPLHAVLGFTELIERGVDGELSPAQLQSMKTIGDSGRRLLIRLHEVFDTALLDVGRLDLIASPTLPVDLVEQAVQETRQRYAGTKLEASIRLETGLPQLRVDPYRIVQAITYLLAYGIEATPEQGSPEGVTRAVLTARMKAQAPRATPPGSPPGPPLTRALELTVWVPSAEVDDMERAHVLDSPNRAPQDPQVPQDLKHLKNPRRKGLGLGLGPHLARRFVELHGGHIVVTTPAQGLRFEITLPQA